MSREIDIVNVTASVSTQTYNKLHLICMYGHHEPNMIAGILLDEAIAENWENLKKNPKYKKLFDNTETVCQRCGGRGVIESGGAHVGCPTCSGMGKINA